MPRRLAGFLVFAAQFLSKMKTTPSAANMENTP